jgi:hypothetical protein
MDLHFQHLGPFAVMTPRTVPAIDWLADKLPEEKPTVFFRGGIVVENETVPTFIAGARAAGLHVEG